jgi:hypothetical protein
MIDLKAWDRQDRAFRDYVRTEARRAGNYKPMRDKLLMEICCHYELESDEFDSANDKAERILKQSLQTFYFVEVPANVKK